MRVVASSPERSMSNYSSMKLELLTLKWAVTEKFPNHLLGAEFAYTDNNPLSHLQMAKLGAMELRWAGQLAQYKFSIEYRSEKAKINADALVMQRRPYRQCPTNLCISFNQLGTFLCVCVCV